MKLISCKLWRTATPESSRNVDVHRLVESAVWSTVTTVVSWDAAGQDLSKFFHEHPNRAQGLVGVANGRKHYRYVAFPIPAQTLVDNRALQEDLRVPAHRRIFIAMFKNVHEVKMAFQNALIQDVLES